MTQAWIEGRPVSTGEAVREAAEFLRRSRLPLITGDLGDVPLCREAVRLAEMGGGVFDHGEAGSIVPLIEALRESGIIRIAPAEARRRARRVLVLGDDPFAGAPDLFEQIFSVAPDLGAGTKDTRREIVLLGPEEPGRFTDAQGDVRTIACPKAEIGEAVGVLRAALANRPFRDGPFAEGAARALARWLKDAGFAVLVFDAARFDAIDIEAIAGLVSDLNEHTRASTLPIVPSAAMAAAEAALWATGFPLRSAFGREDPEHDMVLNDGARLVSSGECDARLLVSLEGENVDGSVPTVLLSPDEPAADAKARIAFRIGRPGVDHGTIRFEPRFSSFVTVPAETPGALANAADILRAIADRLEGPAPSNAGDPE